MQCKSEMVHAAHSSLTPACSPLAVSAPPSDSHLLRQTSEKQQHVRQPSDEQQRVR